MGTKIKCRNINKQQQACVCLGLISAQSARVPVETGLRRFPTTNTEVVFAEFQ